MTLTWDPLENDFYIDGISAREFYIRKRKAAKITISELQVKSGITHPGLYTLEWKGQKPNNSIRVILIALEALGFSVYLEH